MLFARTSALAVPRWTRSARRLQGSPAFAATLAKGAAESKTLSVPDLSVPPVAHAAYEMITDEMVDEYGVRATLYKHTKSGAEVLSVQAADENKVFGITFRTPPKDSTGVPHILEHSVLCGSKKYKSKEPFVELLKGSLQTFLNAFTYPDRTCYPVASCNLKDFYNLVNVYLDAVLHPRAIEDERVLLQEGWHYEIDKPDEPLTYKGVVFNEMKGVYSSPDSLLARAAQQATFPDNTYGVDSGGDPLAIPTLDFEGFKDFHGEFYHPANSRVFFYGDDPVADRLALLDSYLADFNAIDPNSKVGIQRKLDLSSKPRVVEKFPAPPEAPGGAEGGAKKGQNMVQVNWLLNEEAMGAKEQLTLAVLDYLLMGTSSSDLRKALTDSQLGNEVIGGGLSDELSQATFSAGLKGVKPEDVPKVEALIEAALDKFALKGPDASAVEAAINSIEFSLREFNTGSFPRGLSFMLGAMSQWIYDRDPLSGLRFEAPLAELKAELARGEPVFADMVKALLLENKHKVSVEMVPDASLESEQTAAELAELAAIKASMSPEELERAIQTTADLKAAQARHDTEEELATIPSLSKADLARQGLELPFSESTELGAKVLRHDVPSNGILYADVGLDLTLLDAEDLPLVGLLSRCLTQTGTSKEDETALSRRIGARTGGVYGSTFSGVVVPEDNSVAEGDEIVHRLFVRGKVVKAQPGELFDIVSDVLTSAKLDNQKRIVEMLKESVSGLESNLVASGHAYASTRLSAPHSLAGALGEATGGISSLLALRATLEMAEKDFPRLQARLERMRAALLRRGSLLLNLSGDAATLEAAEPEVAKFLEAFPEGAAEVPPASERLAAWKKALAPPEALNEGFVIPTQVNYVGKGGRLYAPGEKVPGSASVVARALRTGYLWDTVRVMGGAYGGFCRFSPLTGTFSYLSYRDPNLLGTLENYDGAGGFLGAHELSDAALEQAIIGAIGDLDGPLGPDQKGFEAMRRYLVKETAAQRQEWRDGILATTKEDFKAFGERLAAKLEAPGSGANAVVFGSKQALEDANAKLAEGDKMKPFELKEVL